MTPPPPSTATSILQKPRTLILQKPHTPLLQRFASLCRRKSSASDSEDPALLTQDTTTSTQPTTPLRRLTPRATTSNPPSSTRKRSYTPSPSLWQFLSKKSPPPAAPPTRTETETSRVQRPADPLAELEIMQSPYRKPLEARLRPRVESVVVGRGVDMPAGTGLGVGVTATESLGRDASLGNHPVAGDEEEEEEFETPGEEWEKEWDVKGKA